MAVIQRDRSLLETGTCCRPDVTTRLSTASRDQLTNYPVQLFDAVKSTFTAEVLKFIDAV